MYDQEEQRVRLNLSISQALAGDRNLRTRVHSVALHGLHKAIADHFLLQVGSSRATGVSLLVASLIPRYRSVP